MKSSNKPNPNTPREKFITTILISILLIFCQITKCNIWDNLYSQYSDDPIKHLDHFVAFYKLREFSNLGLALSIRYDRLSQRLAMELISQKTPKSSERESGVHQNSLAYINLDFTNLDIQMSQKNHKACLKKGISKIVSLDMTDLDNIWKFIAFKEGDTRLNNEGEELPLDSTQDFQWFKKYLINLDALNRVIPKKSKKEIPEVYAFINRETDRIEYINIKLTSESVSFKLAKMNSKQRPKFKNIENCTTSIQKFQKLNKKVGDMKGYDDPFGLQNMMKDISEGILDKFISASEELKKIESNINIDQ